MTTINVTNAKLNGTFTGSIEYEGDTPPTQPPPTGPTGGKITKFNPAMYETQTIDANDYTAQISTSDYAYRKLDDYTLRFEIRKGDQPGDDTTVERSQLQCYTELPDNTPITAAFRVTVEPGGSNTANWFLVWEWTQGWNASPPIAIELLGDRWSVVHRWCKVGGNPANGPNTDCKQARWTAPANLKRGQEYVFEIEAHPNQNGGYLRVKLDGQQVVDYTGPLGFGQNTGYMMFGLYREANATTFAAQYKNMTVSWAKP